MAITADYYVDPVTGLDTNDGLSTSTPFATFQKGADTATAGQIVALKAGGGVDESITISIALTLNSGVSLTGRIKYVGVNSLWEIDGTRYVIEPTSGSFSGLKIDTSRISLFNLELNNFSQGYDGAGYYNVFANVVVNNAAGKGFDNYGMTGSIFMLCSAINCGEGFYGYYNQQYIFCSAISSAGGGLTGYLAECGVFGCVISGCGRGIIGDSKLSVANCVINNCSFSGIFVGASDAGLIIVGNRITNCAVGINHSGNSAFLLANNYFHGNVLDHSNVSPSVESMSGFMADSNQYDTGATDGYVAPNAPDYNFNLVADAVMRDVAITLPE